MEFVHRPYQPGETIAAIATPPGEGGVAIVRISGNRALDVVEMVFSGPVKSYQTHTVHYGKVIDPVSGRVIDTALLIVMRDGRSYTGEETVEIHCHGGGLISRRVLEVVLASGARAAQPGEFTFRAFINGKLDLAQAEAVQELICAKNEMALDAAENQLQGALSQKIAGFQKHLTVTAAILEAWVDFPEEGIEFASLEEVSADLENAAEAMRQLARTFHDGKILHDGVSLCLVGSPNVGKSSLMNALLDKERAIVTHIPGTTRDVLEDQIRLNGLNLRLIDTAGIRDTSEVIEREGIRRTREAMKEADLVLLVLDVSRPLSSEDRELASQLPSGKTIVVWNKVDLPHGELPELDLKHKVAISAKNKIGLQELRQCIDRVIWEKGPPSKEEIVITNVRHKEALVRAIEACEKVIQGLRMGASPEFLTFDLRECLAELGQIIGTNIAEDVLSAIFSKFCIGK